MEARRVLHYGADSSFRTEVLRFAGYDVEECTCAAEFVRRLRSGWNADLICITESPDAPAEGALAMANSFSSAPVVLFRVSNHSYIQRTWDLEVQPLTSPSVWLKDVATLVSRRPIRVPTA